MKKQLLFLGFILFSLNFMHAQVVANTPSFYTICEVNTDGYADFDLESKTNEVIGTQDPTSLVVTYHETSSDAIAGTNELSSPYSNIIANQQIFVRITDTSSGLFDTTDFYINTGEVPNIGSSTSNEVCDDNNDEVSTIDLTLNDAWFAGDTSVFYTSYYLTQADASNGTNIITNPTAFTNFSNPQTLFVRVEDPATLCYETSALTIHVLPNPTPGLPSAIEVCDNDGAVDGFYTFDLTVNEPQIFNGEPYSISYYESITDANSASSPITNPTYFSNTMQYQQAIFVRVESTVSGCFTIIDFDLIVSPVGLASTPDDLEICDDDGDGFAEFDLDQQNQQILGGQDPSDFFVMHYVTQADADAQMNPLSSPYTNTTNPQTIYAVVQSVNGNCTSNSVTYNLLVNTLNINPQAYDMFSCGNGNGVGFFDLTIYEGQITNGNPDLVVSYFQNINDANNNTNVITNPTFYENYSSSFYQTIYIRIENVNSGCVYVNNNTVLYLNVSFLQINQPTPLVEEDPDNDGFTPFNLIDKDIEITNGTTGLTVTYHESLVDADNDVNALASPYINVVANQQTVYVRVENINDGCSAHVELVLLTEYTAFQVNPATLGVCGTTATGEAVFDLTTANPDILSNINASNYTVAYYQTNNDANAQTNAITNPSAYTSNLNTTTVYAGVTETGTGTGDYVTTTISLVINTLPIIQFNDNYFICQGDTLELAPYTLTQQNCIYQWNTGEDSPTILITQSGDYTVTITNTMTGCINIETTTVEVGNYPTLGTASDLTSCNPNQAYDLSTTIPEILDGLDPLQNTITFYESASDAASQVNEITDPSNYFPQNDSQNITASVSSVTNSCFAFSSFNVITSTCPVTVICGQPVTNSFCYESDNTIQYTYTSSGGTPLQLVINSGQVEENYDALIVLDSDGVTDLNAATPYGNAGDVTNLVFAASGDTIIIYVDSDGSVDCQGNNYSTIDYVVSCLDTSSIPTCDAVITTPQNLAIDVNENTDISWTLASGYVTGYNLTLVTSTGEFVLDMVDVGNVSTYNVGTLNYNTGYFVTVTPYNPNGNADNCNETSFTTRADPNVMVDCASGQPVNTSFCYANDETLQYNFSSNDGSALYIVFNSGSTEFNYDDLIVLDSDGITNLNADNPYGLNDDGDLTGLTFTTTGTTATVYIASDGSVIGCENDTIDFDVFCASSIGFIEVNAFLDDNNDGVFNGTDTPFTNGFFTYEINNDGNVSTVNSNTGSFTIVNQIETDAYDITFAVNTGYESCFTIPTALFEDVTVLNGSTVTIDFPVTEQMSCEDLSVYLIPFSAPRPGFTYWNDLVIENLGATTITSGTVTFINDTIVDYVDATPQNSGLTVAPTATGAIVDFTNLLPGESRVVWFKLFTPATVNLGELVTSSVVYSTAANDVVSENNVSVVTQEVIGSYDPNDITESHGREIVYNNFITTDEYLYYTIRFQNIGTAEAINVRIENTVDTQLDLSTLQFIRATHDVVMMQNANQLTWTFDNINLPAQAQDNYGSNGYVHFRIKPTAGYTIGTIIPNTAEIYFDFNAPVITNTFETEFVVESLSVEEFNTNYFTLYPNPASSIVNIKLNNALRGNATVEVIDVQGKIVIQNTIDETLQLNVKNLEAGLYFVKLKQNKKQFIKKLIIE
ncbi:T9SS type A sorting domain-containing protein [Lacinutrix sp. Bg11-31]|uniref:T9SS type A sorting domain-containing protein n=1 Tax=Lacinutrix sp. Bg11-31 TaxID=2057808 RepID=UPI000C315D8E|nr:T9SS type A sorting domain-containing protein [Lacinutrix sp. Bg11-31]AUC80852.1 hypothetical protein CW733_01365 [Lacinutrix sp. Bg11-31]